MGHIALPSAYLYDPWMRATVEIHKAHWRELRRLAAERGESCLSSIVRDALDLYFAGIRARPQAKKQALQMRGVLGSRDAMSLERSLSQLRASWR